MPAGRRRGRIRQTAYDHQNHGETHERALHNNRHISCARDVVVVRGTKMSNSDMTVSKPSCRTCLFSSKQTANARHFEHATSQCTVAYHQCGRRLHVPSRERDALTPGSLGPFPFTHWGLWVPSLLCTTHTDLKVPLFGDEWQSGSCLFGIPARGPSRPLRRMAGSRVAAHWYGPPLSGGRRPPTHSPRREVVSAPRLLGVSQEWRCLSRRPCCREAVRKQSLWVASPRVLNQLPFSSDRSLGRRPSGYSLTAWVQHLLHEQRQ